MENNIYLVYSTHRPETLKDTSTLMHQCETIILEEPEHPQFQNMLTGLFPLDDFMLEQDLEYPEFSREQYLLLQNLHKEGKRIVQTEPYLDRLLEIHFLFAEEKSPADVLANDSLADVYQKEKSATGTLIQYYKATKSENYQEIIPAMLSFAKADADRFKLRDEMRAEAIISQLNGFEKIFIEAGEMHLYLGKILEYSTPSEFQLRRISINEEMLKEAGRHGKLMSPGDELTAHYIFGDDISIERQTLLASRALILSKTITKEENNHNQTNFSHLLNELEIIEMVNQLDSDQCELLFQKIKPLNTDEAFTYLKKYTGQTTQ